MNDQTHFKKTYQQVNKRLKKGSLVVFDKGANSTTNIALIRADEMHYITAKKLNKSDDKIFANFKQYCPELIDAESGVYGMKITKPSSVNYFYFSEKLQKEQLESRARKVLRQINEAKELQAAIDKKKKIPKRFRVNNELIDVTYSFQTKLVKLSEDEAIKLLEEKIITGREGFFCLKSSENLTVKEALLIYRKKDSIEKIFHSLKNEIEIKPLRVWTDDSIYGAILIGFIAQMFISMMRYEFAELDIYSISQLHKPVGPDGSILTYANFDLDIPSGTLTDTVSIGIHPTSSYSTPHPTALPSGVDRLISAAQIGIDNDASSVALQVPATITVHYNDSDVLDGIEFIDSELGVDQIVNPLEESTIKAYSFDTTTSTWQLIPESVVNTHSNTVTFQVCELGTFCDSTAFFAIGGEEKLPDDIPTASPLITASVLGIALVLFLRRGQD